MKKPIQVKTVEQVEKLAIDRRSVYEKRQPRPIPAAVMMSMQARCVCAAIQRGLFVYEKKNRSAFGANNDTD